MSGATPTNRVQKEDRMCSCTSLKYWRIAKHQCRELKSALTQSGSLGDWVIIRVSNEEVDFLYLGVLKHDWISLWEILMKHSVTDIFTRENGQEGHAGWHLIGYDDSFRAYVCAKLLRMCLIKRTASVSHAAQFKICLPAWSQSHTVTKNTRRKWKSGTQNLQMKPQECENNPLKKRKLSLGFPHYPRSMMASQRSLSPEAQVSICTKHPETIQ